MQEMVQEIDPSFVTSRAYFNSIHASGEINRYNEYNQIVETVIGEVTTRYAHNAAGLRVSKTVDGAETRFVLDGGNVALETTTGVGVTAKYMRGVNLVASTIGGTTGYCL